MKKIRAGIKNLASIIDFMQQHNKIKYLQV